jgi:glycosyltransferase involved in cell wall biosynthesis
VVRTTYLYGQSGGLPLGDDDEVLGGSELHFSERFPGANPGVLARVIAAIRRFAPDIVQLNGGRTVKYGCLARRLSPHARWRAVYRNIGNPGDWDQSLPKRMAMRGLLSGVDGIVALSDGALRALRDRYRLSAPAAVIPNGIDPDAIRPARSRQEIRDELRTPHGTMVVLGVGSLSPEKRFDLLLDAFASLDGAHVDTVLWVVGGGPLEARLRQQAIRLGVEGRVRFTGVRSDVGSLLAAADVFALTSDTEGIPAVILEAGFLGLPTVATRVGGIPACVADGETGLLVPPGQPQLFAAALQELLRDARSRARLGGNARALVERCFTMTTIAGQYAELYRSLLPARNQ